MSEGKEVVVRTDEEGLLSLLTYIRGEDNALPSPQGRAYEVATVSYDAKSDELYKVILRDQGASPRQREMVAEKFGAQSAFWDFVCQDHGYSDWPGWKKQTAAYMISPHEY